MILAAEADNVNFVRRNFPLSTDKAVQLAQFVRFAPLEGDLGAQLRAVSSRAPSSEFDVKDPAGGDQATYDACARHLWDLAQSFALLVGAERVD